MAKPILAFRGATIGYPRHLVLRNVSLEVFPGQSVAVFGPNGSGKTAFLKTVAGILPPLAGDFAVQQIGGAGVARVGYVPQRATVSGVLPLTVGEVVEMGTYGRLKPWQRFGSKERGRVAWAMEQVGLEGLARKAYSDLSGGQQQRVLISRALATDPAVLVMDEPLASLDRDSVRAMIVLLTKLRSEDGLTILWADHLVPALHEVVREVMLIENSRLIRSRIDTLLERERALLASPSASNAFANHE